MKIIFYCIGGVAVLCGVGLVLTTALGRFPPLTGYAGGVAVAFGGGACLVAATKNYRGHWAFVTGVVLVTLAFAAVGGEIDAYRLEHGTIQDLGFGAFLALMFLTFGVLSLSSAQKLHRCVLILEQNQRKSSITSPLQPTATPPTASLTDAAVKADLQSGK